MNKVIGDIAVFSVHNTWWSGDDTGFNLVFRLTQDGNPNAMARNAIREFIASDSGREAYNSEYGEYNSPRVTWSDACQWMSDSDWEAFGLCLIECFQYDIDDKGDSFEPPMAEEEEVS